MGRQAPATDLDHCRRILLPLAGKSSGGCAVAGELIHLASLVHDDIIDNAHMRRGQPTINDLWGNQVSVLTGDHLFATAFSLMADLLQTDGPAQHDPGH